MSEFVFHEYPKWISPEGGEPVIVQSRDEEEALLGIAPPADFVTREVVAAEPETDDAEQFAPNCPTCLGAGFIWGGERGEKPEDCPECGAKGTKTSDDEMRNGLVQAAKRTRARRVA